MLRALALLSLLLAPAAYAQGGPGVADLMAARSYGMGGAYRALGAGTEAVEGNPASLGVFKRYLIELSGAWDPRNPFGFGSVTVMDSISSPMSAGLSYRFVSLGSGEEHRTAHLNTAAFSLPFGQAFHIGLSMRHVLMAGARTANAITGDAGLLLNLGGIVFSASGHNLVDINNPEFPRYFAFSTGWVNPAFSLAADVRGDFNGPSPRFAFSGGAEYLLAQTIPLRAGYSHDLIRNARLIGGGFGIMVDNGQLDLSYQHELGGHFSRLLALTLRMQVN